jgi:four helix bundle protein
MCLFRDDYLLILPKLPHEEKHNLGYQIRRAAISITANIAEGYGRYHYQEGVQFYRISRASLYELKDHLISCYDLAFITEELFAEGTLLIETAKKLLNGFIKFTQNKIKNN